MATVKKVKKAQKGIKATADATRVAKPMVKSIQRSEAEKKLKIAKELYKDNPGKVFKTAVDSAEARLSRAPKQKTGGKVTKAKTGKQMLKRADGSYSQRGLWDNLRAAKGSGKKPTAAMLKQERKIKAKSKK